MQKVTTTIKKETTNILGYAFKNKKLLCYPYRVFKLRTTTGEEIELRPELVNDNNLVVNLHFVNLLLQGLFVFLHTMV